MTRCINWYSCGNEAECMTRDPYYQKGYDEAFMPTCVKCASEYYEYAMTSVVPSGKDYGESYWLANGRRFEMVDGRVVENVTEVKPSVRKPSRQTVKFARVRVKQYGGRYVILNGWLARYGAHANC